MNENNPSTFNRRELLESVVRFGFLGAAGVFTVQQLRRAERLKDDPTCIKLDTCNECIEFGGCSLPKSVNYREENGLKPLERES